ncbi:YolD-like family protein [Metasolibacillus meyeri]|uniref:YolD-like family protein n=1 Tax=Metasolibacillus meyeri TaxID=1071052 RepID=UPI000D304E62|nr:YolD-like family protein [Metasolibacillus meyeri]
MLKDRGLKKWQGMMITEHVELIKEMDREAAVEKRRTLSEWELEDLQMTINQALQQNIVVNLDVWEGDRYTKHKGVIKAIDSNTLNLATLNSIKSISLKNIHEAKLDEYFD